MSSHCNPSLPETVAATSSLATLHLSKPLLSLYCPDHVRRKPFQIHHRTHSPQLSRQNAFDPIVSSRPPWVPLTRQGMVPYLSLIMMHTPARHSSAFNRSLRLTVVFHSPSGIPCSSTVSTETAPTSPSQFARNAAYSVVQSCPEFCALC